MPLGRLQMWDLWAVDVYAASKSCIDQAIPLDWELAERFYKQALVYFNYEKNRLRELLTKSNQALSPFGDPLAVDFGTHRWLHASREEAYSDWLAWGLVQLRDPSSIYRLFGATPPVGHSGPIEIHREYSLQSGHSGLRGRADIIVKCNKTEVLMIEVKLGSADAADVIKQMGYSASVPKSVIKVLLAKDGTELLYAGGFYLRRWDEFAIAARAMLCDVDVCHPVSRAMWLGFIGAVEQNLLHYPGKIEEHVRRNDVFPTKVLDHLIASAGKGQP
jgi:hypothetical protein